MATQVETNIQTPKTVHYIRGYPLLGNLLDYRKDRLGLLQRVAHQGDVYGLHFGPFPGILFNKPEHVQSILVEHAYDFDKGFAIHHTFRPVIGDGIFSSEGDFHRHQRKLMSPPFQPRHIASYAEIMGHYGEHIQHTWPDGSVIDVNRQMTNLTMSIIGKALFDADVFTQTDELGAAMTWRGSRDNRHRALLDLVSALPASRELSASPAGSRSRLAGSYAHVCRPGAFALLSTGLQGSHATLPTCVCLLQARIARGRD